MRNKTRKTDLYNRQLHPEEKTLAKQIADKSGGKYTAAQVEDQMRIMGGLFGDSRESGAPATLVGQMPGDSGAQWQYAGKTDDGKPILTQIIAQPNQQLQSYILANAGSVPAGDVPTIVYDPTGSKGWSLNVTGPFTKFDQSDANYVRDTTAGAASMISTNAGRISAQLQRQQRFRRLTQQFMRQLLSDRLRRAWLLTPLCN